jgi:aspartate ammonia-lyase
MTKDHFEGPGALAEAHGLHEAISSAFTRLTPSPAAKCATRREHDLLGEAEVPAGAYWGIHTLRAVENFPVTGIPIGHFPELIRALALVKQAAARANRKLKQLSPQKAEAIEHACELIAREGRFLDQFIVDVVQGGAGTSTNMNANEVIANLALEYLGRPRGAYEFLHPNDDVNLAQSTNDAYPTALRLAVIFATKPLLTALGELAYAFKAKAVEFADVLKIGRTQLQDAVPMTLGQEFDAFHTTLKEDMDRLREASALFREINLGATAIGTGITADPRYASLAVEELARLSGEPLVLAPNLIEATSDIGAFVLFSGVLKRTAVKLSKICNDLRLLSSGPRAGFGEIRLPPVQAGSSIMPGKVNPTQAEALTMIAVQVMANDVAVGFGGAGGYLEMNVYKPLIIFNVTHSITLLTDGCSNFRKFLVEGTRPNLKKIQEYVERSLMLVTALSPVIGYDKASKIAHYALDNDLTLKAAALKLGYVDEAEFNRVVDPSKMVRPYVAEKP